MDDNQGARTHPCHRLSRFPSLPPTGLEARHTNHSLLLRCLPCRFGRVGLKKWTFIRKAIRELNVTNNECVTFKSINGCLQIDIFKNLSSAFWTDLHLTKIVSTINLPLILTMTLLFHTFNNGRHIFNQSVWNESAMATKKQTNRDQTQTESRDFPTLLTDSDLAADLFNLFLLRFFFLTVSYVGRTEHRSAFFWTLAAPNTPCKHQQQAPMFKRHSQRNFA